MSGSVPDRRTHVQLETSAGCVGLGGSRGQRPCGVFWASGGTGLGVRCGWVWPHRTRIWSLEAVGGRGIPVRRAGHGPTLSPHRRPSAAPLVRWRFAHAQAREVRNSRQRQTVGSLRSFRGLSPTARPGRRRFGESQQTRASDVKGREREAKKTGCDDGQVKLVLSRDEGGMSGSGCLRERLREATYVPLAVWAGGVHVGPERERRVFRRWRARDLVHRVVMSLQHVGQALASPMTRARVPSCSHGRSGRSV